MDIFATMVATSGNVAACRAAQTAAGFVCPLSSSGTAPATHYAASGFVPQAAVDALAGLCDVTATPAPHDPIAVFAAAGLQIIRSV